MLRSLSTPRRLLFLFVAVLVGCGGEPEGIGDDVDTLAADRGSAPGSISPPQPSAGSEEVGLQALVADIRDGIEMLPATVGPSPDSARQVAVRLYVARQEAMEAKWGPGSEETGDSPLAVAVDEAEHRFHELMELLNVTPPPDSAAVAGAVTALDQQLSEVLRKAEEQGIE